MENDAVNHPEHYTSDLGNVNIECIDIARHLPFALGNAVKYIWRAGNKGGPEKALEDLEKAEWYWADWIRTKEHIAFDFDDFTKKTQILFGVFFKEEDSYATVLDLVQTGILNESISVEHLKRYTISALLSNNLFLYTSDFLLVLHKKFEEEMKNNGN